MKALCLNSEESTNSLHFLEDVLDPTLGRGACGWRSDLKTLLIYMTLSIQEFSNLYCFEKFCIIREVLMKKENVI